MTKKENLPESGEQLVEPVAQETDEMVEGLQAVEEEPPKTEEVSEAKYTLAMPRESEPKSVEQPKKAYVTPEIKITENSENKEKPASDEISKYADAMVQNDLTKDSKKEKKRGGKRRVQSKGGPSVMSIDTKRTVETDADKAKNDLIDLVESVKTDKILTGKIQGVERNFQGYDTVAVLYHGVFKVVIPAEEMVEKPEAAEGKTLEDTYHYLVTRRLGAETDYIVDRVFYDEMLAFASRLDAMQTKRKRFYRGGEGALVHEGIRAEARVVSVIRAGIFIDVFGVETFVPLRELSYQRIGNAMSMFKTGDRVIAKILSVDNKDMNNIKIQASVKQASVNPYEFAFKKYSIGNRYVGTVSMVDKNGVFVALEGGVDCLCRFPARGRPLKGSSVTVQILGIDEKSNRIWGIITHASMAV